MEPPAFLFIFLFSLFWMTIFADFETDCIAMDGVSDKNTEMYKGNCLVVHSTQLNFETARDACIDFKHGGHLVFIPSLTVFNYITQKYPDEHYHIGLVHGDASNDIKTDWWWLKSGQQKHEATDDITPWDTAQNDPNYSTLPACGFIISTNAAIRDNNCVARKYICQYGNPIAHKFKEVKGGKVPTGSGVLANMTGISNVYKCGHTCGMDTFCYSFAYNRNTGNCQLVAFPAAEIPNPVLSNEYENYDKI